MTFQPESFVAADAAPIPSDVADVLRALAKAARKARPEDAYPHQRELIALLTDVGSRIEHINASQG